jgi:hypothetical protein
MSIRSGAQFMVSGVRPFRAILQLFKLTNTKEGNLKTQLSVVARFCSRECAGRHRSFDNLQQ